MKTIKNKIINICDEKIKQKWENVGLSFYAFFENKNTNPELLKISDLVDEENKLDHFEKAVKIKEMVKNNI